MYFATCCCCRVGSQEDTRHNNFSISWEPTRVRASRRPADIAQRRIAATNTHTHSQHPLADLIYFQLADKETNEHTYIHTYKSKKCWLHYSWQPIQRQCSYICAFIHRCMYMGVCVCVFAFECWRVLINFLLHLQLLTFNRPTTYCHCCDYVRLRGLLMCVISVGRSAVLLLPHLTQTAYAQCRLKFQWQTKFSLYSFILLLCFSFAPWDNVEKMSLP